MRHKAFTLTIGLLTMEVFSTAAFAQMPFLAGPPGPPPPIGVMLTGVDLTSDQQTAVDAITKSLQPAMAPLMDELHDEHQQIAAALVSSGPVSLSDLAPLEAQSAQTEQRLQDEVLKAALEVRGLLTAEQLATAAQNLKKLEQVQKEVHLIAGPPPVAP
jgi:Spy/CpxP family protein refolding chaperone